MSNAFVNAPLCDYVEMRVPAGMRVVDNNGGLELEVDFEAPPDDHSHVLVLLRSLYGLRQSPRNWHQLIAQWMVEVCGFRRCEVDPCVFIKTQESGFLRILLSWMTC